MKKIGVTGHRLKRITGHEKEIEDWIRNTLSKYLNTYNEIAAYSGMASGVDQIFARVAEELDIPLTAIYAYPPKHFHPEQIAINNNAGCVIFYHDKPDKDAYKVRDEFIVDVSDVMFAVFDGIEAGGVWDTIQYAKQVNKPIIYCPCFGTNEVGS